MPHLPDLLEVPWDKRVSRVLYKTQQLQRLHIKQLLKLQTHHSQIESSIDEGRSVVVDIIEHALGNLQHTLVDNVLVGSSEQPLLES